MQLCMALITFILHLAKCEMPLGNSWNLESEDSSLNVSPIIYLILGFLNLSFLVYIMKIAPLLSDRRQRH